MSHLSKILSSAALICFTMVEPSLAHHSSAPHFDRSKTVVKEGVFTQLKLVNPHAYIYFDVTENGQTNNWRCELSSASQLKRLGWTKNTFEVGQKFTLSGSPAWREDNVCVTQSIELEDGRVLDRNTNITTGATGGYASNKDEVIDISKRETVLPNGQPNISGNWRTVSFGRGAAFPQPRDSENSYKRTQANLDAAEGYDPAFDDPILRCHYVNLIKAWLHDSNVNQITQTEEAVTLKYGFMDVTRTVHLNQDSHPKNLKPSDTGHSIGRWEDNVLIVNTTGFEAGVLEHLSGVMHSDQMLVEERFYISEENGFLIREHTLTDPLYLSAPKTGVDGQELVNLPYEKYGCEELSGANNIRPGETVTYKNGTGIERNQAALTDVSNPNAPITPKLNSEMEAPSKTSKWLLVLALLAALGIGGGFLARAKKD